VSKIVTVRIQLVLFDLDGTLVDTAADLAAAANRQRADRGLEPLPLEDLRPMASHGARGLIAVALGRAPGDADYDSLRAQFLEYYEQALCVHSRLFDGMEATLEALEHAGIRWGIVTNKIARFTGPLVERLGLSERAACVVSGDTTPHAKPHPAPLLHAITEARSTATATIYVGDDLRDVQAGRAAGTGTVIAAYGYLGKDVDINRWGGDHIIAQPSDLLRWVGVN
jgi:N-acetyl-D-muramate 6-phosphate phosphatase